MKNLMGLICTNYDEPKLNPLVADRPVASLPFGGRYRLVDFPLSNMVNSGITTVGVITPYMYRSLLDHIGSGKSWDLGGKTGGLFILPGSSYGRRSFEGRLLMRDLIHNSAFFQRCGSGNMVLSSASRVMNIDYRSVALYHEHCGADITLIYKKDFATPGHDELSLEIDPYGRVTGIGRSDGKACNSYLESLVIDNDLLKSFIRWYGNMSHMDLMEVIAESLKQFRVYAYDFNGFVGAVDDLVSYMKCNQLLLGRDPLNELFTGDRPVITKTQDYPPTKYGRKAEVINSVIGSGSIIEGRVENSIIFRSVHVGPDAIVRNSVIMPGCSIGREAQLDYVICDKQAIVADFVTIAGTADAPFAMAKAQVQELKMT